MHKRMHVLGSGFIVYSSGVPYLETQKEMYVHAIFINFFS